MVNESSTSSERMIERELMVTGEAVALEVVPATVVSRILSGLIDYTAYSVGGAISLFVVMILAINERSEFGDNLAFIRAIISLVILAWIVVIPLLTELLSRGRSLGRMVTGTRVVRDDGGTVRLRHCLVRTLLGGGHRPACSARRSESDSTDLPATGVQHGCRAPVPPGARPGVPGTGIRLSPASCGYAPRAVPRRGAHRAAQPRAGTGDPGPASGGGGTPRHGASALRGRPGGPTALRDPAGAAVHGPGETRLSPGAPRCASPHGPGGSGPRRAPGRQDPRPGR